MDGLTVYETTAQIAVGLVGFAALLNFLNRNAEHADEHTAARGDAMLEFASAALIASFIPEVLFRAEFAETAVWKVGSALCLCYFVSVLVRVVLLVRRSGRGKALGNLAFAVLIMSSASMLQILSLVGKPWPNAETTYYYGVLTLIILSVSTFLAQYKLENPGAWKGPGSGTS